MTPPLRLITYTYKYRSWNNRSSFVADLLPSCDIILIQEHWLFCENLHALNISDQFVYTAISGMDSNNLQTGRPFGGCTVSLYSTVSPLYRLIPNVFVLYVYLTDTNNTSILLISVYLPTVYGTSVSELEFISCLSEVEAFVESQSHDYLIIGDDFNVDFSCVGHNSLSLYNFMSFFHLCAVDPLFYPSIPFTYMHDDGSASSWIDHFLCSDSLVALFSYVSLCGTGSNISDHIPLIAIFNNPFSVLPSVSSRSSRSNVNVCITWHRITSDHISMYCECIASSLPDPPLDAFQCTTHNCTIHRQALESFCISLCNTLKVSAALTLPLAIQGRVITGWTMLQPC